MAFVGSFVDQAVIINSQGEADFQDRPVLIRNTLQVNGSFTANGSVTANGSFTVSTVNGIDVNPGSDANVDVVTLGVTGTPKFHWIEASDTFGLTKGLWVSAAAYQTAPGVDIDGPGSVIRTYRTVNDLATFLDVTNSNTGANASLSINLRLTDAGGTQASSNIRLTKSDNTGGSLDTQYNFYTVENGAENQAVYFQSDGQIFADLGAGTGNVTVFDKYDDAMVLKEFTHGWAGLIPLERIKQNRDLLVKAGILATKDTGSGYMLNFQAMTRFLAGGIYQTRERFDNWVVNEAMPRFSSLEDRTQSLEEAINILREQIEELGSTPRR